MAAEAKSKRTKTVHGRAAGKDQRIRDPIHDLIVFEARSPADQLAWRLLNCREFQRLRRVRQLGFSEFTFPGATHSRLAHSIGVFHTARQLVANIEAKFAQPDEERRTVCLCAALVHDLGHGPFSHVFEGVVKAIGTKKKHEKWTCDIVEHDTEINRVLRDFDPSLPAKVAKIISSEDPEDIFASIVSSQFDADRMDYLRRDRYMCGVEVGRFDFEWLLDNLIAANVVKYADPERSIGEQIRWVVLHPKAREAAEAYLLARYQLYSTIYYHKTTRSAEGMLNIVLRKVVDRVRDGSADGLGLPENHPVRLFFAKAQPDIEDYLRLDDAAVWSLLGHVAYSRDKFLSTMAQRMLNRKLFKSFDISARVDASSDKGETFLFELKQRLPQLGLQEGDTFFEDRPRAKGYDWYDWDAPSALKKVLIRDIERNENIDIAKSKVVESLQTRNFLRVYAVDSDSVTRIEDFWRKQGGAR